VNAIAPADYLAPDVPGALPWHDVPLVRATAESLRGYGHLVDDPRDRPIEIVTWPKPGWRDVDPGTGNEGGTTSGVFDFWWEGETMFGRNAAVASNFYLLGWSRNPRDVANAAAATPERSRSTCRCARARSGRSALHRPAACGGRACSTFLRLPADRQDARAADAERAVVQARPPDREVAGSPQQCRPRRLRRVIQRAAEIEPELARLADQHLDRAPVAQRLFLAEVDSAADGRHARDDTTSGRIEPSSSSSAV
jgi:hypothetical protein